MGAFGTFAGGKQYHRVYGHDLFVSKTTGYGSGNSQTFLDNVCRDLDCQIPRDRKIQEVKDLTRKIEERINKLQGVSVEMQQLFALVREL